MKGEIMKSFSQDLKMNIISRDSFTKSQVAISLVATNLYVTPVWPGKYDLAFIIYSLVRFAKSHKLAKRSLIFLRDHRKI